MTDVCSCMDHHIHFAYQFCVDFIGKSEPRLFNVTFYGHIGEAILFLWEVVFKNTLQFGIIPYKADNLYISP